MQENINLFLFNSQEQKIISPIVHINFIAKLSDNSKKVNMIVELLLFAAILLFYYTLKDRKPKTMPPGKF